MSDEIVREFLVESAENLDLLDRELVRLEKDPRNRDTLASVFRTIHTIKGTCGFLDCCKAPRKANRRPRTRASNLAPARRARKNLPSRSYRPPFPRRQSRAHFRMSSTRRNLKLKSSIPL